MTSFIQNNPFISRLCLWVLLPFLMISMAIIYVLFSSLPLQEGILHAKQISARVTVNRSVQGVPKIKALNDLDAYFALGLCHAQDRLWQMESNKRKALGRLSEVFGLYTLESDKFFRVLDLKTNAQKIWEKLSEQDKEVLIHYADGVNEGIKQTRILPIEFLLNHTNPENWSPIDSILIMQMMTWSLSTNTSSELRRMLLIQNFGIGKTNQLMPPVELPGEKNESIDSLDVSQNSNFNDYLWSTELALKKFIGSNAWVVAGKYTESGFPILANDPHLATSIPSIWYLAHLEGESLDVAGATMPGLPFVLLGRNKHIAWGATTMMADTQDVILEKINPINKNQYEINGVYREMEVRKEYISIKNDFLRPVISPHQVEVRRTVNGPLISDLGAFIDGYSYSLRWTGDDEDGGTVHSFIKLNYAKDWDEFNDALSQFVAPVHNFVYADRQGNIGSLAPGKIPIRRYGKGDIPIEGWLHNSNWIGWIPFSDLPREYNPSKGYIVTANNRVIADNYPYHISSDWASNDRAKRIDSELTRLINEGNHKIQLSDMLKLQGDVKSAYRGDIFLNLSKLPPKNKRQENVLELLSAWDGNMDSETVAGTILQAWLFHFHKLLLEDDVENIKGLDDVALSTNPRFIQEILTGVDGDWCDYKGTQKIESCGEIKYFALEHAISDLSLRLGNDPKQWRWGDIHKIQYPHFPYSKSKYSPQWPQLNDSLLSAVFHRDSQAGGDDTTVNVAPISVSKDSRYSQFWGASYRQLVDMKDSRNLQFEQVTGQSGNVVSKNYSDGISQGQNYHLIDNEIQPVGPTLTLLPLNTQSVNK